MGLRNNTVKVILIIAIISVLPIQLAQSATHEATVISADIAEPTLDGEFSTGEWDDGKVVDVRLDHITNPGMYIMINIKSTFDLTAGSVSFGFSIPDPDADGDLLMIIFQTNTNDELMNATTLGFGKDQDVKGFVCPANMTGDSVSDEGSFSETIDTSLGGTDDGEGACSYSASKYTIEMTFPLDSGDTAGKDFSLGLHDLIHFTVIYFENLLDNVYVQVNTTAAELRFCTLSIGNPLSGLFGIGSLVLYTSLLTSMIVFVLVKRKRK